MLAEITITDWVVLLTALGSLCSAILSGLAAFLAALAKIKSEKNVKKLDVMAEHVQQIEKATNSMKDALVKATGEARFAEGKEAGKNEKQG